MRILALDIATKCGWAWWVGGSGRRVSIFKSGMEEFALGRGESKGMRLIRFRKWLREILAKMRPSVIAYERPSFFRSQAAGECIHGLLAVMQEEATLHELDVAAVQTAKLKKFMTGKGNAKKPKMQAAAIKRWTLTHMPGEDEADALCVLSWALNECGMTKRCYLFTKRKISIKRRKK